MNPLSWFRQWAALRRLKRENDALSAKIAEAEAQTAEQKKRAEAAQKRSVELGGEIHELRGRRRYASMRLTESTGIPAEEIDRFLREHPDGATDADIDKFLDDHGRT